MHTDIARDTARHFQLSKFIDEWIDTVLLCFRCHTPKVIFDDFQEN